MLISMFFCFTASLLVSLYLVPVCQYIANRFDIIDRPNGKLKQQKSPVAYLGGMAIFITFLSVGYLLVPEFLWKNIILYICLITFVLVGLIDDIKNLSPLCKFALQTIITAVLAYCGYCATNYFFWFDILWILSLINAFNLIDIMDGLASVVALACGLTLLACAYYMASFIIVLILSVFLGSVAGFLIYNKPPARIYLGDSGAFFIGSFLSVISINLPWSSYNNYWPSFLISIFLIVILELISLIAIRLYKKIPIYLGSKDHFVHYLKSYNWTDRAILLYISAISALLFFCTILCLSNYISFILFAIMLLFIIILWYLVIINIKYKQIVVFTNSIMLRFCCFIKKTTRV